MKRMILIVEDDADTRDLLTIYLKEQDFIIIENEDLFGNDLKQMPDLILMDNMLPSSLGKDNCAILKNNKYTEHIPIIIMSASPVREESLKAGAAAFIAKPFSLQQLLDTVNEHMPY